MNYSTTQTNISGTNMKKIICMVTIAGLALMAFQSAVFAQNTPAAVAAQVKAAVDAGNSAEAARDRGSGGRKALDGATARSDHGGRCSCRTAGRLCPLWSWPRLGLTPVWLLKSLRARRPGAPGQAMAIVAACRSRRS